MSKLKIWFIERFLPSYIREETRIEIARLREQVQAGRQENAKLNAYISGMHKAMRYGTKVEINGVKQ